MSMITQKKDRKMNSGSATNRIATVIEPQAKDNLSLTVTDLLNKKRETYRRNEASKLIYKDDADNTITDSDSDHDPDTSSDDETDDIDMNDNLIDNTSTKHYSISDTNLDNSDTRINADYFGTPSDIPGPSFLFYIGLGLVVFMFIIGIIFNIMANFHYQKPKNRQITVQSTDPDDPNGPPKTQVITLPAPGLLGQRYKRQGIYDYPY